MPAINMQDLKTVVAEMIAENNKNIEEIIKAVLKGQATKAKRASRDPNMPKRPKNAYQLWCDENREEVKEELEDKSFKEVSKELSRMWKELSDKEKKPYQEQYKKLKKEYDQNMENYKNNK